MRVQRCPGFSITWNLLAHVHATETTSWLKMMMTQFEAKLLDRVERGHPSEIKFLNRTVRWHEDELCFSWSGGARYVEALAKLHGDTGDRSVTKTRTPGTKATGSGARDAPEPLDTFQAAGYRTAVGMIGCIVLDRATLPVCSESGDERDARTEEARMDALQKAGQVPGFPRRTRVALPGTRRA